MSALPPKADIASSNPLADQHDRSGSGVVTGAVSWGWASIHRIASFSEVNFPKKCTAPLGHAIRTRQMPFFCAGDSRVRACSIDKSMIRSVGADKPCALMYAQSTWNASEEFPY